ncbi:M28 family peptidase [Sphingomonas glaciei]|uniref:M28 family peptidase n=1 Tax=Sphingomonas glaciei TaxID=2938948 RepID=A0ABY5MRK3_9SPHN|nr:M28 family peptidase [Sphingomonas glaciei]UUR07119.1 M28 family peptidase [Sphingomonas glaciei]
MRSITFAVLPLAFALIGAAQPSTTLPPTSAAERVRAHVTFLSSDLLEGRDTGSRGHVIAASYVVSQLQALGLKPGGEKGSWYQQVPYRRATLDGVPTIGFTSRGGSMPLTHGADVTVRPNLVTRNMKVNAGLVFVGYGISDPVLGIDDYRGVNARGKIVVAFSGTPKGLRSDVSAHLGQVKPQTAAARGAVGYVEIPANPLGNWGPLTASAARPLTNWAEGKGGSGQGRAAPLLRMSFTKATAERLFAGARQTLAATQAEAAAGRQPKGFALNGQLRVDATSKWEDFTSPNVVAVLPGTDPKLSGEYVALMGHLDHIGVRKGAKPGEDAINNGALDNASGVSTLLETARSFAASGQAPKRSLLFLAVTGEEVGLTGADYFATNPTVPLPRIAALVNLDMPLLLYPFRDVIAFGAEHSNIVKAVDEAGRAMQVSTTADPMPEQGLFTRSDHYRFVTRGVPSVFLMTGYANGGEAQWKKFLGGCYHHPCDEVGQGIDWEAAARFGELNYRIARRLADAPERPRWYADSYFGRTFGAGQPRLSR